VVTVLKVGSHPEVLGSIHLSCQCKTTLKLETAATQLRFVFENYIASKIKLKDRMFSAIYVALPKSYIFKIRAIHV